MLVALMAMQFQRYGNAQIRAFDFVGTIAAVALAMGHDWRGKKANPTSCTNQRQLIYRTAL